jgi:VWFA-related protein
MGFSPSRSIKSIGLLIFLILSCSAFPETKKTTKNTSTADKQQFTFRVPVDVVVVNVSVTDKEGNPVLGLAKDDFTISEDGKEQPIHTFTIESYQTTQKTEAAAKKGAAEPKEKEAEEVTYTKPRLITLAVDDMTSSSPEYFNWTNDALKKFIQNDMSPADQIALMACSGRVQFPFSNDKQLLLDEANALFNKLNRSTSGRSNCPILTDLQAARIDQDINDGVSLEIAAAETLECLNLPIPGTEEEQESQKEQAEMTAKAAARMQFQEMRYRELTLVSTLRQYVRSLRHFDGVKSVTLLSDGFLTTDLLYEIQDLIDQALRSGVVVNTMDIRGLYTTSLQASETLMGSVRNDVAALLIAKKPMMLSDDKLAQEEALDAIAHDTGGLFYHNNNDLYSGLKQISQRHAFYYILSYASPAAKSNGKHHTIKVAVSRPGLELSYRKEYYSPKEELTFERRKKEDILEAMEAPGNLNEIKVGLSYNFYQLDDLKYEVALLTNVDIHGIRFLEEDNRHINLINLVIVAFDENDKYVDGLEKSIDFKLTQTGYDQLLNHGLASKVSFQLPPGRFKIKAVVRESAQSKMGSLTRTVEIP